MRIKKHKNKNEYLLTPEGMWVRDFTKQLVPQIDINKTQTERDWKTYLVNEFANAKQRYPWISVEKIHHEKMVIVSDGYGFQEKHKLLANLPSDIGIIAVNSTLAKWSLRRMPNYYVVNNPYQECLTYLPRRYKTLPRCIASTRTNPDFLKLYRGIKYRYIPVNEVNYSAMSYEIQERIDDYRNPICAAIGLSYLFGVEKLLLLCCDSSFDSPRPGAEQLPNDLWMYPTQKIATGLVDGNLYWLKQQPVRIPEIADHSSGPQIMNATYIKEEEITAFLEVATNV